MKMGILHDAMPGPGAMTLGWVVFGLVAWAPGLLVAPILCRMAGDQDRTARHDQKELDPYSDVTITKFGN